MEELLNELISAIGRADIARVSAVAERGIGLADIHTFEKQKFSGNALHAHATIHHTSYNESDIALVDYLLSQGIHIDSVNTEGQTPLHLAVAAADMTDAGLDCVRALIKRGAGIHVRDAEGRTVLHHAAIAGNWKAYQLLRDMGVDPHVKDRDGNLPTEIWTKLSDDKISRLSIEESAGYRLTEVFNFGVRTYHCVTQNMATKVEAVTVMPLEGLVGSTLVDKAYTALEKRGGKTSWPVIPISKVRLQG